MTTFTCNGKTHGQWGPYPIWTVTPCTCEVK